MCVIVDANVAAEVFTDEPHEDFAPLLEAILAGRIVAVYGGLLTQEYARIQAVRRRISQLERAGKACGIADELVDAETAAFAQDSRCRSDDPHILGLAKVAEVRLLCSRDVDLHADFTNRQLLQPRGQVYQNASHQHLLRKHCQRLRPARTGRSRRR